MCGADHRTTGPPAHRSHPFNSLKRLRGHRMSLTRRFAALATLPALLIAAACGDSDSPSGPTALPVIGVTAVAVNSSSIKVTFTSRTGDNSYTIERAEGATGTFA